MIQKIQTLDAAYRKVIRKILIESGCNVLNVIPINQNRYMIVKTDKINVLITFKNEVFFNFGKIFKDKGMKGVGDSINREHLQQAVIEGATRIFSVFPNGHIYSISIEDLLTKSILWTNKEGKEVYSTSIHNFARVD